MNAREAISPFGGDIINGMRSVPADMPLISVLPLLLDAPDRRLSVEEEDHRLLGIIDQSSLLEALGRMIAPRDDSSVIIVECSPSDYSASRIAHAVEDADVHLVDLLSVPSGYDALRVMLRVRCDDPSSVIHSLERYGYKVIDYSGNRDSDESLTIERLLGVKALLNV